ncbi:hypothetical protein F4803DRAFT_495998 [Xylaria telfairii]|nr:hypothetical protein F4803DRAFT_495998 [Xylaria telfairii]
MSLLGHTPSSTNGIGKGNLLWHRHDISSTPTGPHPTPRIVCPDLGRRCHPRNPVRERLGLLEITVRSFLWTQGLLWTMILVMSPTSLRAGQAEESWPITVVY